MTAVGISIGVSNSSVAVFKDGQVTILANDHGNKLTPSVVAFNDRELLSGEEAVERLVDHPETTVYEIKRMVGRLEGDPEVDHLIKYWPFQVVTDRGRCDYLIRQGCDKLMVTPEEVMAVLIAKMKRMAEKFVDAPVHEAVLTVPACFGVNQRVSIKNAALIAGFQTVHLVNEATAVVLAYVFDRKMHEPFRNQRQRVMVCNLGGGSCDVTTFTLQNQKVQACATNGCGNAGGVDFTNGIAGFLAEELKVKNAINVYQNRKVVARLKNDAERVKKELATRSQSLVRLDRLYPAFNYRSYMSKSVFEQILYLDARLPQAIKSCVRDTEHALEEVFMTGGSSRIPYFRNLAREATNIAPDTSLHAEQSPAIGAAVKAANISGASANALGALDIVDVTSWTVKANHPQEGDQILFRRNQATQSEFGYLLPVPGEPKGKIVVKVYEGDNLVAANNPYLGQVIINLQQRQYQPEDKLRILFVLDTCGIVNVPQVELVPDHESVDFTFERCKACLSEERVNRCKERFPRLGVRY